MADFYIGESIYKSSELNPLLNPKGVTSKIGADSTRPTIQQSNNFKGTHDLDDILDIIYTIEDLYVYDLKDLTKGIVSIARYFTETLKTKGVALDLKGYPLLNYEERIDLDIFLNGIKQKNLRSEISVAIASQPIVFLIRPGEPNREGYVFHVIKDLKVISTSSICVVKPEVLTTQLNQLQELSVLKFINSSLSAYLGFELEMLGDFPIEIGKNLLARAIWNSANKENPKES